MQQRRLLGDLTEQGVPLLTIDGKSNRVKATKSTLRQKKLKQCYTKLLHICWVVPVLSFLVLGPLVPASHFGFSCGFAGRTHFDRGVLKGCC